MRSNLAGLLGPLICVIYSKGILQLSWICICCCHNMFSSRFNVKFKYTTTTLGVDPGYTSQGFYNKIIQLDSQRVNTRFKEAAHQGVPVEKRSVDLADILEHLEKHGPCIVLTNANAYMCLPADQSLLCGTTGV